MKFTGFKKEQFVVKSKHHRPKPTKPACFKKEQFVVKSKLLFVQLFLLRCFKKEQFVVKSKPQPVKKVPPQVLRKNSLS